jgi:NAD-dependent deacetylase
VRERIEDAAAEIVRRGGAAALTGAGVSVESGIPDFRSASGIWARYDQFIYATIDALRRDPARVWRFLRELGAIVAGARPNPAHHGLARLEEAGVLHGIATQNVDALHQAAGSRRVIELHGSGARLRCLRCRATYPPETAGEDEVPRCPACGGVLKPDVILFGEDLPAGAFEAARALVEAAPVLLVVGTSGAVHPVNALPAAARRAGALVVEMNLEETELSDEADISIRGPAGETVPALAEAIARLWKPPGR